MPRGLNAADLTRAGIGAFFRPRDLGALGITFRQLQALVSKGDVEKVAGGLYHLTDAPSDETETVAMVGRAVPKGIVCLLSALRIHGIGTQSPHEVWLGIDYKARKPKAPAVQLRIVRFSGPMLRYGVLTRRLLGVPVRITSPARTVVDCFRYRNKIGLDVALEALRDCLRSRKATADEIFRAAEVCRIRLVMKTYMEALSS